MTSSLLFAGTMCGFTLGTLLVPRIVNFLGRFYLSDPKLALQPLTPFRLVFSRSSRTNAIGFSACQARFLALMIASVAAPTNYVMMGSQKGLPTMFIAYVIISSARAVSTGACLTLNLFLSETPSKLGYAFGAWGVGAVVSPLVFQATAAAGLPWPHFYFGSLVLVAANMTFLAITFMPTAQELTADRKKAVVQTACDGYFKPEHADILDVSATSTPAPIKSPLRLVASMPYQWAVSGYVLFYCGTETTIQGLVVQYLLAERSANPHTVGYISSGFWMGISISRTAWSYFSPRISFTTRKHIIQLGAALSMLILLWFIHSIPENALFVSLIGLLFGPIFPACLELGNDLLPVEVNMISMAIVSAAGSMGSAIFPFITGVITTKYSMRYWSYITLTQVTILFGTWYLFPIRQPLRRTIT
ncbi:major facilitator superfamily domain-containing protein, partial [Mycena pura]